MRMFDQRTQVLLSEPQLRELRRRAKREQKSVGAVIRDAVDAHLDLPTDEERQAAFERLIAMDLPVDDWPVMKAQIEKGMLGEYWDEDDGAA
jgi:hypothetical protein